LQGIGKNLVDIRHYGHDCDEPCCTGTYLADIMHEGHRVHLAVLGTGTYLVNIRYEDHGVHCKPGPFDKQFCLANTAIFTSFITFQSNHNEIFHSRQM
jgi:hypothetical protein